MTFEQVHIGDTAELALESGRQHNDRNLRTVPAKRFCDRGAELSGAKVVVEHRDIDFVQLGLGLLDGIRGDDLVALLAKNRRAKDEILLAIIEQKYPNRRNRDR